MKKKALTVLAASALIALGLAGCNVSGGGSASSSEVESSSEQEQIAGRISIDSDKYQSEIVIGEKNAFDLDTCVTVKRVSSYSVTTTSANIKIDGHKIIGTDYGPWKATIVAGTTKRAISGYVVSEDKVAFNTFFDAISDNYSSMSDLMGWGMCAENYYLGLSAADPTTQTYTFAGGMESDSEWYSFSIKADASLNFSASSLTVDPGRGMSKENYGFGKVTLASSDIVEALDESGNPIYMEESDDEGNSYDVFGYALYPTTDSKTGATDDTNISDFIDSIGQTDYWYVMSKSYGATYLLIYYAPELQSISMYPCGEEGVISAITDTDGEQFSTAISIGDVNAVKVKPVEDWIANPTYPEAIDVSAIQNFFDNVIEKKSYTLESYGKWYNPTTGEGVDCPKNMHFSDTGEEAFSAFQVHTAVNANMYEETTVSLADNYGYSAYVPAAGTTALTFIDTNDGNALKTVDGLYDSKTGKTTYNADDVTTDSESGIDDLWDTTYTPSAFGTGYLTDEDNKPLSLLSLVSFRSVSEETDDTGKKYKIYTFNSYGEDFENITMNSYIKGAAGIASILSGNIAFYNFANVVLQEWTDYVTFAFTLAEDNSSLTFAIDFNFSSSIHYAWGWMMGNIGTDSVSAEAKALLTPATPAE